jgi:hypothetical protein
MGWQIRRQIGPHTGKGQEMSGGGGPRSSSGKGRASGTIIQRPVARRLSRILAGCCGLDNDEHMRSGLVGVAVMVIGGDGQRYGFAGRKGLPGPSP